MMIEGWHLFFVGFWVGIGIASGIAAFWCGWLYWQSAAQWLRRKELL